jgi:hypothetical protein
MIAINKNNNSILIGQFILKKIGQFKVKQPYQKGRKELREPEGF